jgi:hypothetical protein
VADASTAIIALSPDGPRRGIPAFDVAIEVLPMKCPKCRYTSFPHLENCPKCGFGLAEQRAAFGIYALRPDPPDLLQAYEAGGTANAGETMTSSIYSHVIDPGPLEGIDLEVAEAEPGGAGADDMGAATIAPDLMSSLGFGVTEGEELAPEDQGGDRLSTRDPVIPENPDLRQFGDVTLALDNAEDLESESPPSADVPGEFADVKPVYDLDVDEALGGLTLSHLVESGTGGGDDGESVEFTLEIEEDVEFEVDRLELEQDEEAEDEDGHGR